jgi:hypothetical protein
MCLRSFLSCLASFSFLSAASPTSFFQKSGSGAEAPGSSYELLTLNACMMRDDLAKRWGGMRPAAERIDRLANFILKQNPDVFFGQEIMTEPGEMLYDRLKGQYSHFWIGIGIGIGKNPGKEESGLFVASKKPVKGVEFYPFGDNEQVSRIWFPNQTRFLERGFFVLDFGDFLIATTHLEGGGEFVGGPQLRIDQFRKITAILDAKKKPYAVLGDLNLNRTGKADDEYSRAQIPQDYFDFYTTQHPEVTEETSTCTNLFTSSANNLAPPPPEEESEIDDYFLIRKSAESSFKNLNVHLIDTYDVKQPADSALTDHKAYKISFDFKKE